MAQGYLERSKRLEMVMVRSLFALLVFGCLYTQRFSIHSKTLNKYVLDGRGAGRRFHILLCAVFFNTKELGGHCGERGV